jgi:hypothetical protein
MVSPISSSIKYPTYFFKEFVTKVRTSWFSSSSSIVPKYPNRLSANRGDARSLRHSIWPKCVLSPSVKRYKSFATLFRLRKECQLMPHCLEYCGLPDVGVSALLPKACSNRSTFFLDNCSFIRDGLRSPHIANKLLQRTHFGGAHNGPKLKVFNSKATDSRSLKLFKRLG